MKIDTAIAIPLYRFRPYVSLAFLAIVLSAQNAPAQFHKRGSEGTTTTPSQAPSNVDMRNWSYGEMEARNPAVFGRAIFHPNGNYTESKLNEGQRTLQQFTYREKQKDSDQAILLQKRLIKLDSAGRPKEVMIYDAEGRLTNRGTLFYDSLGRFSEERVFDTSNTLVRRRIQPYSSKGEKLPLRTFNYGNGPAHDVDLLITRESVQKESQSNSRKEKRKSFLKKLQFWKKKDRD